jgi:alpha,alpha-trehalase
MTKSGRIEHRKARGGDAARMGRIAVLAALAALAMALPSAGQGALSPERIAAVRGYIAQAWTTLTRSNDNLPEAAVDPKLHLPDGASFPVYLAADEDRERVREELLDRLGPDRLGRIDLRTLPPGGALPQEHGLLYLPHPYVVPGGRFNEMYGWDSYFIQVGLLRDDRLDLARDMAENFVYEVDHYGTVLNANRTYFLTRSQPPFLTRMLLGVFERTGDHEWLRRAWPAVKAYYAYWTREPHLVPAVSLARYYDRGEGPAAEVLSDERDAQGRTHYDRAKEYYRTHQVEDYDESLYYDPAANELTPLFYKGDRSMRESGFDPSDRFGSLNVDVVHYVPVCLNALLFRMEQDSAEIAEELGLPEEAWQWRQKARERREAIDRHLWDPEAGLYFDYNFETGKRRHYEYVTTFYPLWAGAASPEQARRVRDNLSLFEAAGGLLTSTRVTGQQWDAPFGWAPLQLLAVEGLRRYGYEADADRIARKFLGLVAKEFQEHGTIVEKYDVRRRESDVAADIRFGYSSNEIGFGWTNAAFEELLATLRSPVEETKVAAAR